MAAFRKRPALGSLTGRVWDLADEITIREGRPATRAEVAEIYLAEGGLDTTCRTQFSRWKQAHSNKVAPSTKLPDAAASGAGFDTQAKWDVLLKNGFTYHADWSVDGDGRLRTDRKAADGEGVYVFVIDDEVVYVGVSDRLSRRMGNYRTGHIGQRTSHRIHALLLAEAKNGKIVKMLTATPGKTSWNGFDVHIAWGLERALIAMFRPRWNIRS